MLWSCNACSYRLDNKIALIFAIFVHKNAEISIISLREIANFVTDCNGAATQTIHHFVVNANFWGIAFYASRNIERLYELIASNGVHFDDEMQTKRTKMKTILLALRTDRRSRCVCIKGPFTILTVKSRNQAIISIWPHSTNQMDSGVS